MRWDSKDHPAFLAHKVLEVNQVHVEKPDWLVNQDLQAQEVNLVLWDHLDNLDHKEDQVPGDPLESQVQLNQVRLDHLVNEVMLAHQGLKEKEVRQDLLALEVNQVLLVLLDLLDHWDHPVQEDSLAHVENLGRWDSQVLAVRPGLLGRKGQEVKLA